MPRERERQGEIKKIAADKGLRLGKSMKVMDCCREIRICPPRTVGEIASGFDPDKGRVVHVICSSINNDYNKTIVTELLRERSHSNGAERNQKHRHRPHGRRYTRNR